MSYSQFIHGKIVGERHYRIVALTPDLAGRTAELETIAQQYRFWGQQPPDDNPVAVGVFHHNEGLLLAQAMPATYSDGRPALDGQNRPFSQHRYIFLPADTLDAASGRLWLLLNWVMEETRGIPIFSQVNETLRKIPVPRINGHWHNPAVELDKLQQSLQLRDTQGRQVLLAVLAALVNGKRVVFDVADTADVFSEDLLEGALLLLPAVCRTQVSIAAGALDETVCTQATLMVKTNGTPTGPLGEQLIWAKRANNQFFGAVDDTTLRSDYTTLLQTILNQPNALNILLRILDEVQEAPPVSYQTPWQALNNGWLATRLIPALPDPKERAKYWQSALKGLAPAAWDSVIPAIIDDVGLEIAWTELQKQAKETPAAYAPLVFKLWRNFSAAYITYTLETELPADLALAEALLKHGLCRALGDDHQPQLRQLALTVIQAKARTNQAQARQLAQAIREDGAFDRLIDHLAFQEAALLSQPTQATVYDFLKTDMAALLPQLTSADLAQSRTYQRLVELDAEAANCVDQIVSRQARALPQLPALAAAVEMTPPQTVDFYAACLEAWQPPYKTVRPLLTDLVTRWIASHPPETRPALATLLQPLSLWLRRHAPPEVADPFLAASDLISWQALAHHLFDSPLGQVSFLDHVTVGQPVMTMSQIWLAAIAADRAAIANFEVSYTWHTLQEDGPSWLSGAVSQLLGWQETSLSALLPIIERLQATLDIPQPLLFQLLEALPIQRDDNLGMLLVAYLPGLIASKTPDVAGIPLWQMLHSQAPKVAQVYKVLAEGQKNVAVELLNQRKLNSALTEAPEYAEALAQWLQLCGKGDWISGRLLEAIVHQWCQAPKTIDVALLTGLLQPDVSRQYSVSDWMALAKLCWQPAYQPLWPMNGQPSLNAHQRAQVLGLAKTQVRTYETALQTERLLTACQSWGLTIDDVAELVGQTPPRACNFALLNTYLYSNGTIRNINSAIAQSLYNLAMRLGSTDDLERTQLKTFLTALIRDQLPLEEGITFLANWHQVAVDKPLYQQAFTEAALQLAPDHFSMLVKRGQQFQRLAHHPLCQTLTAALDVYWQQEKQQLMR